MGFDGVQPDVERERPFWVAFHRVPYVGPVSIRKLLERFGSLEAAWHLDGRRLRAALNERAVASVESTRRELDVNQLMSDLERDRISVVTLAEEGYPRLLREIHSSPPVLFYRGDLIPEDATAVAIVGTRQVTAYGRAVAEDLAGGLARAGITIVSGLAKGVDGIAHRAALEAGGRTIAVLGGGINRLYPYEHRHLAERITTSGAVLSDYFPDSKPEGLNFPARNRIISGLSLGVIVVEAPEKSGALITVDFAADQGRDVFAVPGPLGAERSAGCNRILRDGARLVRSADDVLEDLRLRGQAREVEVQQALPLGEDERRVLAVLTGEPMHIDDICEQANLSTPLVSAHLITMELQGLVRNAGAQHYVRSGRPGL
ncbi:MAG TPA: DNA-processing protein DprA [Thermomicrobiales bacterium]|nr:DNA-processing protein DprA [Thermomicrobiales bacterium]